MEVSCGQPFTITGPVHANSVLYVEPDSNLVFKDGITSVGDILFQRDPLDSRGSPAGSVDYQGTKGPHSSPLTLPIGTNNTPLAISQIIQPPGSESISSPLGQSKYYNEVDMIVNVFNSTNITATSGRFDGTNTVIPTSELKSFITTTNSFYDKREDKTVAPIDINIKAFKAWSGTNKNIYNALGKQDVSSIYVWDRRSLPASSLGAVRLYNGAALPSRGLTVATADPLYVWGDYNQPTASFLGTTNTTTTMPASLAADAITILSTNWSDARSFNAASGLPNGVNPVGTDLNSRAAKPTTVNAAFLSGAVDTTQGNYSGGMENFPRFLETWGASNPFTYNGSMIKMFPSLRATNIWGKSYVYNPPARKWSFDLNFKDPSKLPPLTPSVYNINRSVWSVIAANSTTKPSANF